jgi:hypothetical protein
LKFRSLLDRKGTIYLPKFQEESQGAYDLRKASAPWRPEFTDALGSPASKPFSKPVKGNSLQVFAHETFYYGVGFGFEAIYVTYPEVESARNLAAEKQIGDRPYCWVPGPGHHRLQVSRGRWSNRCVEHPHP